MSLLNRLVCAGAIGFFLGSSSFTFAAVGGAHSEEIQRLLADGESFRSAGNIVMAQSHFDTATARAKTLDEETQIAVLAASGYNEHLLEQDERAEKHLLDAYRRSAKGFPYLHAVTGNYLGLVKLSNGARESARKYFSEALASANAIHNAALGIEITLNLAKLETDNTKRVKKLFEMEAKISDLNRSEISARYHLNVGEQLLSVDRTKLTASLANRVLETSYRALVSARLGVAGSEQNRLKAEIEGAISRLYKSAGRDKEALRLTNRTINLAQQASAIELLAIYETQRGQLLRSQGDLTGALGAYRRAASHLTSIRGSVPINLPDGRSSVDALIDPVYRGYADILLQSVSDDSTAKGQQTISSAITKMEAIKTADLQNYFLERCNIGKQGDVNDWQNQSFKGVAVVYPVLLPDRVEILIKSADRILRKKVGVPVSQIASYADQLAYTLRNGKDYRIPSRQLYEWLFRPIEKDLETLNPDILLYVPDRSIRSIPLAALHDGNQFVVSKYAVVTLPGIDIGIFHDKPVVSSRSEILIAGISVPDGPSIDQLPRALISGFSGDDVVAMQENEKATALAALTIAEDIAAESSNEQPKAAFTGRDVLIEKLSLPGVEREVTTIGNAFPSQILLNQSFTAGALESGIQSGGYPQVHIASHGYFGKNARESFIMAYDKNLNLIDFEGLLQSKQLKQSPIDLLTLSACETATGDDRVLLGFSGLAIKSNALSAIGTLWASDDQATLEFMTRFYKQIGNAIPKAQAMRQAQLAMLDSEEFRHPYFWSPFVLIGNWH